MLDRSEYLYDYLYMLQASTAIGGFLAIFLVFRYQIIDKYVDNRKEALRVICDIAIKQERAEWIQNIGKFEITNSKENDRKLIDLNIPSVETFINEIYEYREWRKSLVKGGNRTMFLWAIWVLIYLFAQIFDLYNTFLYIVLMVSFVVPIWFTRKFLHLSFNPPSVPKIVE